ncbi:helix-turn-helix transcriptional regulator [Vibrio mediterranei]|uniref:Helix-turn-helix transcriptional regulator n=1 Tax=Vibrio mediterranei TaxID=689 RepID=A0AAN1FMD8_9VIBR|nr:LuxR C-terminal-related transcriptional regulator [Vibrio mediterranei]ASI93050.1 helix-turn-helix transcriptional regulator [Vibrio mediterranei]
MLQKNSVNFIVIEPQPLLQRSLLELLSNQIYTENVYSVLDCEEAELIIQHECIQGILFDPMNDLAGASKLVEVLSNSYPHIYTIAYTMNTSMSCIQLFGKMNIMGVVCRLDSIETLESALSAAASGYEFKKYQGFGKVDKKQLSERELLVLKLLSEGHRNKEVARRLNISDKTVATYKKRVLEKLEVSNIIELMKKTNDCADFIT